MNISATFIHKPIATGLSMAAILLLGLISYELLPVAALPNIATPTVMVTAQFPGADAQTVVVRGQYRLSPGTMVSLANSNDSTAVPNPTPASAGLLP